MSTQSNTSAPVSDALDMLKKAMAVDKEYAWGWHCNVAMSAGNEGLGHLASNRTAARFMKLAFGVDMTESEYYKGLPWEDADAETPTTATPEAPASSGDVVDIESAAREALSTLRTVMANDDDYAYQWHRNLKAQACEEGVSEDTAERLAAKVMKAAFHVDFMANLADSTGWGAGTAVDGKSPGDEEWPLAYEKSEKASSNDDGMKNDATYAEGYRLMQSAIDYDRYYAKLWHRILMDVACRGGSARDAADRIATQVMKNIFQVDVTADDYNGSPDGKSPDTEAPAKPKTHNKELICTSVSRHEYGVDAWVVELRDYTGNPNRAVGVTLKAGSPEGYVPGRAYTVTITESSHGEAVTPTGVVCQATQER